MNYYFVYRPKQGENKRAQSASMVLSTLNTVSTPQRYVKSNWDY